MNSGGAGGHGGAGASGNGGVGGTPVNCDADGDTFISDNPACDPQATVGDPRDCDDADSDLHPFVPPVCGDGAQQACPFPLFDALESELGGEVGRVGPIKLVDLPSGETGHPSLRLPGNGQADELGRWTVMFVSQNDLRSVEATVEVPGLANTVEPLATERFADWPFDAGTIKAAATIRPTIVNEFDHVPGAVVVGDVGGVQQAVHWLSNGGALSKAFEFALAGQVARPIGSGLAIGGMLSHNVSRIVRGDSGLAYTLFLLSGLVGFNGAVDGATIQDIRSGYVETVVVTGDDTATLLHQSDATLVSVAPQEIVGRATLAPHSVDLSTGSSSGLLFLPASDGFRVYPYNCVSMDASCSVSAPDVSLPLTGYAWANSVSIASGGPLLFSRVDDGAANFAVELSAYRSDGSRLAEPGRILRRLSPTTTFDTVLSSEIGSRVTDEGREAVFAVVAQEATADAASIWALGVRVCNEQ